MLATAILLGCLAVAPAWSHEVRPAYLELRETSPGTFDLLWKVPARGDMRLGLYVELSPAVTDVVPPRAEIVSGSFIERRVVRHAGGLVGETIRIAALEATRTDVLVRLQRLDGTTDVHRLTPKAPSMVVAATPGRLQVASTYLALGVEHILLGVDHLAFVLALVLLVRGMRRLVWTITAFTLAHSLTLAGATLGIVQIPIAPVEACIALSIMYVATEIVHARRGTPGLTARRPWVVAFLFGLLHGFGFASALHGIGLPQSDIPLALLFFNLGVEFGQLAFIAVVLGVAALVRRSNRPLPAWAWRIPPYAIGSVASFWLFQRLAVLAT